MTLPQKIYLFTVATYVIFFALFIRFFFWKRYAEKHYWNRRPQLSSEILENLSAATGKPLPRFSILVPARNEADVIEKTIAHMDRLNYPQDLYEVLVVTDEKELLRKAADKPVVVRETLRFLAAGAAKKNGVSDAAERLTLGLLTHLSLLEIKPAQMEKGMWRSLREPSENSRKELVREIAEEMVRKRGRISMNRLFNFFHRLAPELADEDVRRVYPYFLSIAVPVVAYYCTLRRDLNGKVVAAMIRCTAQAHHEVTQKILRAMTDRVNGKLARQLSRLRQQNRLEPLLELLYDECFPTTQDIVERKMAEFTAGGHVNLKHVVVPDDFDGAYGGTRTGKSVPSTKGRALNYAMRDVNPASVMCAFYDAEGRPDSNVLQYVAYQHLKRGGEVKIFQGPVFQVRNFFEMSPFCKVASLFQCISHDWFLPVLFRRIPFVGGTNLFVNRELLLRIGGFDHSTLTEDLELGTRAYLHAGVWPEYLPYGSSEQTPPTFRGFFRQRLRWATGHLQVMEKIARDPDCDRKQKAPLLRSLFVKGQLEWVLYQTMSLVPPFIALLWWNGLVDYTIVPYPLRVVMSSFTCFYLGFLVYLFFRYSHYFDDTAKPHNFSGLCGEVLQLFVLPLAAFFFPAPNTSALVLRQFNLQPKAWVKTPRTRE
ncbi:MAG: glycosyltransferase [bacterium]|jgi:cellulose synthase/poly-beta-1,6-N-acetylglucosamine synthase-like glycosyltransferase